MSHEEAVSHRLTSLRHAQCLVVLVDVCVCVCVCVSLLFGNVLLSGWTLSRCMASGGFGSRCLSVLLASCDCLAAGSCCR